MAKLPPNHNNDLFTSVISEIKKYTGKDPLLPWIQGIKKIKGSLPPQLLKEKLPRFLQKCAQTFQSDRKYHNDFRYVRVWIQLMDFVDDPRALLKTMEMNHIGTKQALFYQAYALYFVKLKKFEEADKMYHLGVQNSAEPVGELQKSYEQFLRHMKEYKEKRTMRQERRAVRAARITHSNRTQETKQKSSRVEGTQKGESNAPIVDVFVDLSESKEVSGAGGSRCSLEHLESIGTGPVKANTDCNDETVVSKFVDTAFVGKSEAEDACHHGLVEPTINMKEAMNAINSMFREPIELEAVHRRKSRKILPINDQRTSSAFEVFLDEDLDNGFDKNIENGARPLNPSFVNSAKPAVSGEHQTKSQSPPPETFKIFDDDEYENEDSDGPDCNNNPNSFVFPRPVDLQSDERDDSDVPSSPVMKFREDTVVGRFVGSAILDEPEVENACHHGLVDPTINLKEAMDAINSMFGKPLDFVKANRSTKPRKIADEKKNSGGFSILADEELGTHNQPRKPSNSCSKLGSGCDLFEPTINTKKAMDDINEMFGMPLDF